MERRRNEWGVLCAVISNSNPFGGGKARSPLDFYPDERRETQRQSAEEQENFLRGFFSKFKKKT